MNKYRLITSNFYFLSGWDKFNVTTILIWVQKLHDPDFKLNKLKQR